jgi:tRNA nucleotidyltransferase (CCA-adding enzyme)
LEEIERVIAWYHLLYLEETFAPWKVYWHGLTSALDLKALRRMADRMGMNDWESQRMISQRERANGLLDALFRFEGDNYHIYTLLVPYDTEILLCTMAQANSEKIRRLISLYFTRLKGTKVETRGKDLLRMGLKSGPVFSEIFERLLEARLNDKIKTKADEIRYVTSHYQLPRGQTNVQGV